MPRPNEKGRVYEAIQLAGKQGLTFDELKEATKLSRSCLRKHLAALVKDSRIETDELIPDGARACLVWFATTER